eukprot:4037214-Pleurochrysis_carterae.AAC.1
MHSLDASPSTGPGSEGRVSTPFAFITYLREAIPGGKVHPLVEFTHDYATFFDAHIYDSVEGIVNDARDFIIKERDDGGAFGSRPQALCISWHA